MVIADQWDDVDAYLRDVLVEDDEALREALATSAQAGLPDISVTPTQG